MATVLAVVCITLLYSGIIRIIVKFVLYQERNMNSQTSLHRPAITEDGPERILTQSTTVAFCLNATHSLTQFCLGGAVITALLIPIILENIPPVLNPTMQHIILCTIGYFCLIAQAILAFSPFGFASNLKYENKKMIHAVMQIVGSALAIAGGSIRLSAGSWTTSHGVMGIIALAFTAASLIGGVVNYITSRKEKNNLVIILHSCLGTLTIIFAYITLILAFSLYYNGLVGPTQTNFAIALASISLVGTVITASATNIKRILVR